MISTKDAGNQCDRNFRNLRVRIQHFAVNCHHNYGNASLRHELLAILLVEFETMLILDRLLFLAADSNSTVSKTYVRIFTS